MRYSVILLVLLGGCSADLHTKKWATDNLKETGPITVIENFLELGFSENRGMVFGILNEKMPALLQKAIIIFRLLILLILTGIIWWKRNTSLFFLLPFLLFWAGGTGNLIDSINNGYIVDFIHIRAGHIMDWPFYFNLADAYVTIGIILLVSYELKQKSCSSKITNVHYIMAIRLWHTLVG